MPQLPKFLRGGRIDYFGKKRIKKDVAIFVEELNLWLDQVFLYQRNKTDREAERFIRQLSEQVGYELSFIMSERKAGRDDVENSRKRA